jgi:hypothetical protein
MTVTESQIEGLYKKGFFFVVALAAGILLGQYTPNRNIATKADVDSVQQQVSEMRKALDRTNLRLSEMTGELKAHKILDREYDESGDQ